MSIYDHAQQVITPSPVTVVPPASFRPGRVNGSHTMLALLLLFTISLCISTAAWSQTGALQVGNQSPTAASLGKFGDVPVSLYTGTPSISIPLHEIDGPDLSLAISLSYHASGVKVEEAPGWVGMGWALNAGGVITRTTRGIPDDGENGFFSSGSMLTDEIWADAAGPVLSQDIITYIENVNDRLADPEPDQYFFNFAGRSGQFVPDREGNVRPIPYSEMKIEPHTTVWLSEIGGPLGEKGIPGWTITDTDGTQYIFEAAEITHQDTYDYMGEFSPCSAHCSWVSSWFLTKILSPSGDDTIELEYHDRHQVKYSNSLIVERYDRHAYCDSEEGYRKFASNTDTETPRLKKITHARGEVEFYSSQRSGFLISDDYKLDSLQVRSAAGTRLKSVHFTYDDKSVFGDRLFLTEVQQHGDGIAAAPYQFAYHEGHTLPGRLSNNVDHWGFSNGASNQQDELPSTIYQNPWTLDWVYASGADRAPNVDYAMSGVLTKVTYPTGGYTEFDYESHDYGYVGLDLGGKSVSAVPGSQQSDQVTAIYTGSGGPVDEETDIQVIHVQGDPVLVDVISSFTDADEYSYTEIFDENDNTVYSKTGGSVQFHAETIALVPGTYTLKARAYHGSGGVDVGVDLNVSWHDWIEGSTLPAGGLRIQQMVSHDGVSTDNDIVKTYTYVLPEDDERSSGVMLNEARYYYFKDWGTCTYINRSMRSVAGLGATQGSPIGYAAVQVHHADGGLTEHRFTAGKDVVKLFQDPDESEVWPFSLSTRYDYQMGRETQVHVLDENDVLQVANERSHLFIDDQDDGPLTWHVPAITIKSTGMASSAGEDTYVFAYKNIVPWVYLQQETVTHYNGTDSVERIVSYEYDDPDHRLPTKKTESGSNVPTRVTQYEYAHENHQPGMENENMLAQPYRTTLEIDGVVESRTWTTWEDDGGHWRAERELAWDGSGSVPSDHNATNTVEIVHFVDYDTFGRPTEQQDGLGNATHFTYAGGYSGTRLSEVSRGSLSVKYEYENATGRLIAIEDENGNKQRFEYDGLGRLQEVQNHDQFPILGHAYHFTSGNVGSDPSYVETIMHFDAGQSSSSRAYVDGLGRGIQEVMSEGATNIVAATAYDEFGRAHKAFKPYRVEEAAPNFRPDAESEVASYYGTSRALTESLFEDTPLERPVEQVPPGETPGGDTVILEYGIESFDGSLFQYEDSIDEKDRTARAYLDVFGRTVATVTALGSNDEAITHFDYDGLDNLIDVTTPEGLVTSYTYNALGHLIEKDAPDVDGIIEYRYDSAGNLRFVQDPEQGSQGDYIYHVYDEHGRTVESGLYTGSTGFQSADPDSDFPLSSGSKDEVVGYTYDTATPSNKPSGFTIDNPKGQLVEVVFPGGMYHYSYDQDGNVQAMHVELDGPGSAAVAGKTIEYEYDRQGNVTKISYQPDSPESLFLWYAYDDAGRLAEVRSNTVDDESESTLEAAYSYIATGQIDELTLGPETFSYDYHLRDWLVAINDPGSMGSSSFAAAYQYDPAGQMTIAESHQANSPHSEAHFRYSFAYDDRSQLTEAVYAANDGSGWTTHSRFDLPEVTYDLDGNILALHRRDAQGSGSVTSYTYESNTNRLDQVSGGLSATFNHDKLGNMTEASGLDPSLSSLSYGWRGLPTSMTADSQSQDYYYDADGQRVFSGTSSSGTFHVRGLGGAVLAVYDENDTLLYWNLPSPAGEVLGRIEP